MGKYDSIINLPHKQSTTRPHMSISDRAAQFAPFAVLAGYENIVKETARLTDNRRALSEEILDELNRKLFYISAHISDRIYTTITCFQEDTRKAGGAYLTFSGIVKSIDSQAGIISFEDGSERFLEDITAIDIPDFPEFEI